MDNKGIFRKVALERLSSPDKLDQLIQVVSGKAWLVLTLIVFLVTAIILWSIFGRIDIEVQAEGVLLRTGGILNIYSFITGEVTDVAVRPGANVERGDVIARIMAPEILSQMYLLKQQISDKKISYETQLQHFNLLQEQLQSAVKNLKDRLKQREILFNKGLLTKDKLLEISAMLQTKIAELDKINLDRLAAKDELDQLQDKRQSLKDERFRVSRIDSPYTGKIVEVKVKDDQLVESGSKIASLELIGKNIKNLEATIYVSYNEGTKITKGMDALISPNIVEAEEYGTMLGKVISVSMYPLSSEAMLNDIGNEDLVKRLTESGPKYAVSVDLKVDVNTVSGYAWTSSEGPPLKISSGTVCSAFILLEHRAPISFVLPFLKKTFGVY
jgi:HlyD family secretion protein